MGYGSGFMVPLRGRRAQPVLPVLCHCQPVLCPVTMSPYLQACMQTYAVPASVHMKLTVHSPCTCSRSLRCPSHCTCEQVVHNTLHLYERGHAPLDSAASCARQALQEHIKAFRAF